MKKILLLLTTLLIFTNCQSKPLTDTRNCIGTSVMITIYDHQSNDILNQCFDICNKYDLIFSSTNSNSELYKINHSMNKTKPQKVSTDLYSVLEKGLYYSNLSHGSFDITIGSISSLWEFNTDKNILPDDSLIQSILKHVGYQSIVLSNQQITFKDEKTMIDLGAIAKGYIADRIKDYLLENHVKSALINLGGNILCVGSKYDQDFTLGITDANEPSKIKESVNLSNLSLVTSGTYQRYIDVNNKRYHHILNPETGYSYENHINGITIISKESIDGDGLSTVCFSLGKDRGLKLLESINDVEGYYILDDGSTYETSGFKQYKKQ